MRAGNIAFLAGLANRVAISGGAADFSPTLDTHASSVPGVASSALDSKRCLATPGTLEACVPGMTNQLAVNAGLPQNTRRYHFITFPD